MRELQPERLLSPSDPSTPAVTAEEHVLSWDDVERRSRCLARALDGSGLGEDDVWGVLARNRVEWAEFGLGDTRAGTRLVPLNWHLTATEIAALLDDSGCQLVVVEPELRKLVAAYEGVEIVELGEQYEAWLDSAGDALLEQRPSGSLMMFTGGTTGKSKGVNRPEPAGPVGSSVALMSGWGSLVRMPDAGTTLITTPLYHAFGNGVLSASLARGLSVVMAGRFDPLGTLEAIERHRITATPMVPTQFLRLLKLDDADRTRFDLSSLEWVLHTAAPCPAWAKVAMIEWLGPVIYEMYGSSEGTGPAICDSHEWLAHPGTVGKATARIEYSIVDDDGNDLPPGEVGTIYCRRSDGAPEYHGDPDKTASIQLPDGRFTVGDLGWLDDDGYLFLADRRVDLILVAGSNVYPAEIEAVLSEHPSVADVAVFGIPDPEWGEQVKAVIEPAGEVDLDDLRRFAADRLAPYKLPKSYDVVDRLPREAHGKLKKRLLRDPYWAGER
jgi:acyl-CoA synthetase (AMP-forming)/AMP-acid ligase II